MTNNEYKTIIKPHLDALEELIKSAYQIGKSVIGESLFKEDLYFVATLNRFVALTDGFKMLIINRNLTCCGALLRLLLDNCMRLYALNIADDMSEAIDTVISGGRFDKLKDKNGKQMRDGYLKEQIANYDAKFKIVYDSTSGYIHFSEKGFFQSVRAKEDNQFLLQISTNLNEEFNPLLIEGAEVYIHFSKFFLKIFDSIIQSKKAYDEQHKED